MKSTCVLLLITLGFLLVCSTAGRVRVSASGTGIGICVDGPFQSQINETISYSITLTNLGDYYDRNLTVTDKFPNGTSSSWNIPNLAPLSQPGYQYTISGVLYAIRPTDVLNDPPPEHVDNNVVVMGYAYASVSNVTVCDPVQAEASFTTVIGLSVGGYSVPLEPECLEALSITYFTLVFAIIATLGYLHLKFKCALR